MLKNLYGLLIFTSFSLFSIPANSAIYYYYITDELLELCQKNDNPTYMCRDIEYELNKQIYLIYLSKAKKVDDVKDYQPIIDECFDKFKDKFPQGCIDLETEINIMSEKLVKEQSKYTTQKECEAGKMYIAPNGAKRTVIPGSDCK